METEFLFYWSIWLFIFILYAYIKVPDKKRYIIFLMLLIIASTYTFHINAIKWNGTELVYFAFCIYLFVTTDVSKRLICYIFVLSMIYFSLCLFFLTNPIMFTYFSIWTLPLYFVPFILFLMSDIMEQVYVAIISMYIGKNLYELLLIICNMNDVIGMYQHYIEIHFVLFILLFIYIMKERVRNMFYRMKKI